MMNPTDRWEKRGRGAKKVCMIAAGARIGTDFAVIKRGQSPYNRIID
jgi:hypothetical protein